MSDAGPPSYQERTWGAMLFMLTPVALVGILVAQSLAAFVSWWFAVPLAIVLSIGLIVVFHLGQGGGFKVVELGCSSWILVALLMFVPSACGLAREQRDALVCRDNLRRIGEAMRIYASANDGFYPPRSADWKAAIRPLLPPAKNTFAKDPFVCPTTGGHVSYFYRPPDGRPKPEAILIEESPFGKLHRMGSKTGTFVLLASGTIGRRDPVKGLVPPQVAHSDEGTRR